MNQFKVHRASGLLLLIAGLAITSLSLTGCGKYGPLQPPETTNQAPASSTKDK